jgi:hypothetical protein
MEVAQCVVEGLKEEKFLTLSHPQVTGYMRRTTEDYDHWIAGMSKLRRSLAQDAH